MYVFIFLKEDDDLITRAAGFGKSPATAFALLFLLSNVRAGASPLYISLSMANALDIELKSARQEMHF